MKEKLVIGGLILVIIFVIYMYISLADFTPKEDKLLKKIEKLEIKIDSLEKIKDSIRTNIDSTKIKIVTNEKHYQDKINIIVSQPYSVDSSEVTNYIRLYSDKNPQYNFSRTREINN